MNTPKLISHWAELSLLLLEFCDIFRVSFYCVLGIQPVVLRLVAVEDDPVMEKFFHHKPQRWVLTLTVRL